MRKGLLLCALLLAAAHARQPGAAVPATPPGQVQPVAPGTRAAPVLPALTLTPPIPQVQKVEYLGNGYIEVAHAVILVTPSERAGARALMEQVARRVLAARPGLSEVDLSVYGRGSYAGFGGPLPLLTASVPRGRLEDFAAWTQGRANYDRAWQHPGNLPAYRAPDPVLEREATVTAPGGSPTAQNRAALGITTARVLRGAHGGLLFQGRRGAERVAALTFDDAPHPLFEPLLLDLLRRSGARATFFVIGRNARAYPYFIRDMAAQGHEIGNHTYHHVRLPPLPLADTLQELQTGSDVIRELTGRAPRYFRPPGGEYTPAILQAAQALGLTTVFWTDDPGDFQNPGDGVLTSRLDHRLRPGGIVLLHDNAPEMLDVLRPFLHLARREHVTLTTVGGLPK